MIDFTNIGKHSYAWDILVPYLRFAKDNVFFKEHLIVGKENIPKPGTPIFVIANHQNSLIDPLMILTMFKDNRQPVFLARGDIFKKDIIAKCLRFFKVMPTFRMQDGGRNDLLKNMESFKLASQILKQGGVIVMFPEAGHQQGRYLASFKKGVPRVCFGAEEAANFELNLQILPVNLHFSNIHNFDEKVLIQVGKPFTINEFFDTYKSEPNLAFEQFNAKARPILKDMMLHIDYDEHYFEVNFLREMIRRERLSDKKSYNYFDEFNEEKNVIAEINNWKENDKEKFAKLMTDTKQYKNELKKQNLRDWVVGNLCSKCKLFFLTFLMFLISPIFFFGAINNAIPCYISNIMTKKLKDKVFVGSLRFGIGFFFFPIWYLLMLICVSIIASSFIFSLSYVILAFISLFIYLRYQKNSVKLCKLRRYLKMSMEERESLNKQKRSIIDSFS